MHTIIVCTHLLIIKVKRLSQSKGALQKNSSCQHLRKCVGNGTCMGDMYTDVKQQRVENMIVLPVSLKDLKGSCKQCLQLANT